MVRIGAGRGVKIGDGEAGDLEQRFHGPCAVPER